MIKNPTQKLFQRKSSSCLGHLLLEKIFSQKLASSEVKSQRRAPGNTQNWILVLQHQ